MNEEAFIDHRRQIWRTTGISNDHGDLYLQHQPSGIGGYFSPPELAKLSRLDQGPGGKDKKCRKRVKNTR